MHLSLAMYDKAANREPGTNWTSSLKGQTYLLTAVFLPATTSETAASTTDTDIDAGHGIMGPVYMQIDTDG